MAEKDLGAGVGQGNAAGRVNTTNDVFFKWLLGQEERKGLLIDFLNAVLDRRGERSIKDLQYLNGELEPFYEGGKVTRLDILCTIEDGTRIDIEVQVANERNMESRTQYYASQMFCGQLKQGGKYQELRPVIVISLLGYVLFPEEPMHTRYGFYNLESKRRLNNDMELHFLEIPKLQKKKVAQMSRVERWVAYFSKKFSPKELEELAMSDATLKQAFEATRKFLADEKNWYAYMMYERQMIEEASKKAAAQEDVEKGRKEGLEEGEQKGRDKARITIAKNLKELGIDRNSIAKSCDLTLDEIEKL